jgi:NAD(P)-dependent dehydrogenase (short-subunit alcohol dehydrogenase family)
MSLLHTFGPFLWDSRLGAPTAEATADRCLSTMPPAEAQDLKGKIAIVTGCTLGGIGAVTASVLAGKAKMRVVLVGRTMAKLEKTAERIEEDYPEAQVIPMTCDVSLLSSVRAFVGAFEGRFPAADFELALLVNNAGIMAAPYATTPEGFETQ